MLVTVALNNFPRVGQVTAIPPDPSLESTISIQWMIQERAPHKPKWQRCFKLGSKKELGETQLKNILLYGFQLTNKGCLKKSQEIT